MHPPQTTAAKSVLWHAPRDGFALVPCRGAGATHVQTIMLETENGTVSIKSIKNGMCTFSSDGQKPEVAIIVHRLEHIVIVTVSYSRINLKYYCNSSAVNKVFDHAKFKENVHK